MNITCPNCGQKHALFWLQGTSGKKVLHYTCDRFQARRTHRLTGNTEVRNITKRCQYHLSGPVPAKILNALPVVLTKSLAKQETDAHQEKLSL